MILRSVTKHFKEQNWVAVGLDFFIVVFGVFVGLQVSDWSDARNTDRQSALFTKRLMADLRMEAFNNQVLVEYYEDVLSHAGKALQVLEGKTMRSDEALMISAYRASQDFGPPSHRTTYDELTSTGSFNLIRDQVLRETVMKHYNEGFTFDRNSRYREAFRMAVSVEVQNTIAENCGDRAYIYGDYTTIVDILDYDCTTGLSPEVLAAATNGLRADETIVPLLRLQIINMQTLSDTRTRKSRNIQLSLKAVVGNKS
jgi:hypothetical protein